MTQLIVKEVRRALQYGNPWLTPRVVMAYTRLPIGLVEVKQALLKLIKEGEAVSSNKDGDLKVALATAVKPAPLNRLGKRSVLDILVTLNEPAKISLLAERLSAEDWRVRHFLMSLVEDGLAHYDTLPGTQTKVFSATGKGRRKYAERLQKAEVARS